MWRDLLARLGASRREAGNGARPMLHSRQPRAADATRPEAMPPHELATDSTSQSPHGQRGRRDGALLVTVFTALLVLPPVGHHLIVKSDEARFVLLARDMVERGAWFTAAVEGQQYRNKPPLFPWTIALLSKLRGAVTEGTAQLPAAIGAI